MKVVRIDKVSREVLINPIVIGREVTRRVLPPIKKGYITSIPSFGKDIRNRLRAQEYEQILVVTAGKGIVASEQKKEGDLLMSERFPYPRKIVSGGQTGVDRAALDVAFELGIPCGGWCPKGRLAEDGVIDERYPLRETDSPEYPVRTEMNVKDSDATLIITQGPVTEGTARTLKLAEKYKKTHLVVDLSKAKDPAIVRKWLEFNQVGVLNVAGPRESKTPGIYDKAAEFLRQVLVQNGKGQEMRQS